MLLLLTFVALGTSLIWTGLTAIGWGTVAFTIIALTTRTVVLYPVLARAGIASRDRRIIALFGPRGLSSLLLVLLPVFAGVEGAEQLFTVTCLVVLASVFIHGVGIAMFMRKYSPDASLVHEPAVAGRPAALPVVEDTPSGNELGIPGRITVDEVRQLQALGKEIILIDARADRNRRNSDTQAAGSIRVHPFEPVRDATALRLSQRATLVVYCA